MYTDTSALTGLDIWASILTIVGSIFIVAIVIEIAKAILMIVVYWKIFKKAGKSVWASLIPGYNIVILSKVAGINIWVSLGVLIADILCLFIPEIVFLAFISSVILGIIISFKLPAKFGKGAEFGVGLMLLPVIFYPILAFGKSEYQG